MSLNNRLPSLDGLRAFSILLVCIGHVAGTVDSPEFLLPLHNLGNFGVKIFFVISGFLITYLLLIERKKTGSINLKQFYIRRTIRLFPAFYFFVICIAIANYFQLIELRSGDLFHASTYTMNFHHDRAWWLNHTWSLAVEEQFYLLWPLLLMFIGHKKSYVAAFVVILAVPLIRTVMWYGFDASPSAMTREFQAVADALATGCILAYAYKKNIKMPNCFKTIWFHAVPLLMFIVPMILMKINPAFFYIIGQSFINICAAVIIWRYMGVRKGLPFQLLNLKPVIWLGGLSYSLYLWQEPFLNSWVQEWYASWPLNIILTLIFAVFSYYIIEKPFMQLRKNFHSCCSGVSEKLKTE